MKVKTILFMLLAWGFLYSQLPPPQDTIIYGGVPSGAYNWSQGLPTPQHCPFDCEYNTYNCWQLPDTLPDSLDGVINVAGNASMPFGLANIVLLNQRRYVLEDTCNEIGHPFVAPFTFFCSLPPNSQVCVFWDSTTTDSVGVLAKSDSPGQKYLGTVLADLALCWMTTHVDWGPEYSRDGYYDKHTLQRVDNPIPNVGYLKRD
jgi:hypothetical protein